MFVLNSDKMAAQKICRYCKLKDGCKDFHPIDVCKEQVCNVAKCLKRHPKECRYFRSGSCRFKESCKYDHKEYINTNELLLKIKNLENENQKLVQIYENQILGKIKNLENENLSM